MSPRLGTYRRAITRTPVLRQVQNRFRHGGCFGAPWPAAAEASLSFSGRVRQPACPPPRTGRQWFPLAPRYLQQRAWEFLGPGYYPTFAPVRAWVFLLMFLQ